MNPDDLRPCPAEGTGVHSWMFASACYLRRRGYTNEDQIFQRIESASTRKDAREISDAVRNSAAAVDAQSSFRRRGGRVKVAGKIPKAEPNKEAIARLVETYGDEQTLRSLSPADVSSWTAENVIDLLFPESPLLCFGKRDVDAETRPRELIRGTEQAFAKIVPNPMTARHGTNKNGKRSPRCLDNTGARRFLVCEFDHETRDTQSGALLRLAELAPLTIVVWSGGKSLHGWFFCEGVDRRLGDAFFKYATSLGADPALYTRCQLARFPGGTRFETGAKQEVIFINPYTLPGCATVPPPDGYCPRCWFQHNTAYPINSPFPCGHGEEAAQ